MINLNKTGGLRRIVDGMRIKIIDLKHPHVGTYGTAYRTSGNLVFLHTGTVDILLSRAQVRIVE